MSAFPYQLLLGGAAFAVVVGMGWLGPISPPEPVAPAAPQAPQAPTGGPFGLCHVGGGRNCVVDGDTIWIKGENVRIADVDAPETHEYRCAQEKALGDRATARLRELVNSGTVSLEEVERDRDGYGRKLRRVLVDGRNVGDTLIGEGLARKYERGRRSWC